MSDLNYLLLSSSSSHYTNSFFIKFIRACQYYIPLNINVYRKYQLHCKYQFCSNITVLHLYLYAVNTMDYGIFVKKLNFKIGLVPTMKL